jgi:hypothetical protein
VLLPAAFSTFLLQPSAANLGYEPGFVLTSARRYINALEERIAFLEGRMPEYGQDHFNAAPPVAKAPSPLPASPHAPPPQLPPQFSKRRSSTDTLSEEEDSSLVDGVAYLSLCASGITDTAPEPFYLGSSSGATIARMIQSSIFQSSKSSVQHHSVSMNQHQFPQPDVLRPSTSVPVSPINYDELSPPLFEFPPRPQAQVLFSVFFDKLHTRWPILDRAAYLQVFERQWDQGALPLLQRSILHLIYAISARFLQLMKKNHHVDHEVSLFP